MIVSMPDDAVTAQRRPGGNGAEQRKTNPSQPKAPTPQATARDASGGSLQRLLNVTIDCMRGRYDR